MANARSDVQLIISAKNEASKAIEAVASALTTLNDAQTSTAAGAGGLGSNLLKVAEAAAVLEGAYGKIDSAATRGDAAFGRQQSALEETRAQLAAVTSQIEAAGSAIAAMQGRIVDTKLNGGDTGPLIAQLKAAQGVLPGLQQQQAKLTASVEGQQAAVGRSINSLQQLGSVANAAEAALVGVGSAVQREMLQAAAATEAATEALRAQAAAARADATDHANVAANNSFFNVTADPKGAQAKASATAMLELMVAQEKVAAESAAVATAAENEAQALRDLAAAAKESAATDAAQQRASKFLGITADPKGAQAGASAEVFQQQQAMADAVARLRAQLDPLGAIQAALNTKLEAARALYQANATGADKNAISAEELAAAEKMLALEAQNAADHLNRIGKGAGGAAGMFGLKPYELTNLGYQINDVVSGIAMGQPLVQIFAQQGGQILQLFPKIGDAIILALGNPYIIAAVATFALLAAAVAHVHAEAVKLREIQGILLSLGDGSAYSAKQLADTTKQLELMGVAAAKASAAMAVLVRANIAPEKLAAFATAARNLSVVMGTDLPQAAKQVADGFAGGEDAVLSLQKATGFLSDAEVKNIRDLYDHGKAADAATQAFNIFAQRMDDGAKKMRGEWAGAAESFGETWDHLLEKLGKTVSFDWLQKAIVGVGYVLDRVNGDRSPQIVAAEIQNLQENIAQLKAVKAGLAGDTDNIAKGIVKSTDDQLASANIRLAGLRREFEALTNPPVNGSRPLAAINADAKRLTDQIKSVADTIKAISPDERQTAAGQTRIKGLTKTLADLQEQYKTLSAEAAKALASGTANKRSDSQALDDATREIDITRQQEAADAASARAYTSAQKAAADAAQVRIAGEKAYRDEIKKTGTEVIAAARRAAAEQQKAQQLRLQREQGFGSQAGADQRASLVDTANSFRGKSENSPGDRATLEQLFKVANINIDPKISAWCAAFVNAVLATSGLPTSAPGTDPAAVRAKSFLNYGTAVDKPERGDIVVSSRKGGGHVGFFEDFDKNGNPRVLGGNTGGKVGVQTVDRNNVLGYRRAPSTGDTAESQAAYNKQLDISNALLTLQTAQAKRLMGLSGEQLLAEQRKQAIETAVYAATQATQEKGLVLSAEQKAAIETLIGKQFDLAHAQEQATIGVTQANNERQALLERLQAAQTDGDTALVKTLRGQIDGVNTTLTAAIDKAEAFWKQFDTPEARTAISNLEGLRTGIGRTSKDINLASLQSPVDQLGAQRSAGLEQVQALRDQGQVQQAQALRDQIVGLDSDLLKAIDDLIAFWSVSTKPEAAATILSLQNMRAEIVNTHQEFKITAGDIQQAFANDLVNAFDSFAQAVAKGDNVFGALGKSLIQFTASFLRDIAMMLLKMLALKLAMKLGFGGLAGGLSGLIQTGPLMAAGGALGAAGVTLTASGAALAAAAVPLGAVAAAIMASAAALAAAASTSAITTSLAGVAALHGGGLAGSSTLSIGSVMPGVFAGAQRFHSGGLPGLRSNEIPTILERGEEVLTRGDSRHVLNGGKGGRGGGAAPTLLRQTLVLDPGELARAMSGRAGESMFMTHLRANKDTIQQELGVRK